MNQKYLSPQIPLLADGDFMGIFVDGDQGILDLVISEGLERGENIVISAELSDLPISNTSKILSHKFSDFGEVLQFLKDKRSMMASTPAGFRILIEGDLLNKVKDKNEKRSILDQILIILMSGDLSVGVFHGDIEDVTLNEITCYPRVLVNGSPVTNKFFVLPNRAKEVDSEIKILFEDLRSKSLEFVAESEPFPIGVPDMLEAIIESMGVGIVVGDNYGNMVLFNEAARTIMGLSPSPLPYAERIRRFGNYLPDKVTPYPFEELPLSRAIRGENFEQELIYIKNKNKPSGLWVQTTGRGVKGSDGKLIGGVIVFRDVTEERKIQEEKQYLEKTLVQNQKLESLGVLAGGIAHDFNNLLVGVLGNASIVLQQGGVLPNLVPRIEQIQQAGSQLSDLTKQLLIYAGLNPNKEFELIDINQLVNSMVGLVEAAVSKKMEVDLELSSNNLCLKGDKVQLRQILLNLALNAADAYGSTGGNLMIRTKEKYFSKELIKKAFFSATEKEGTFISFEIEDFAGGIDDGILTKIFDPFFSTKGIGRGLGLSAVLGIVKAHNGILELNTLKGQGTIFTVWFYKAEVAEFKVERSNTQQKAKYSEKKVLLIDDEELVLEVADSILSLNGLSTLKATSGREGLRMIMQEQNNLSLVILDMNMPDLGGEDVYIELRKHLPNIPVIISSGFCRELCSIEKFEDVNCHFLEKPYSVDKLLNIVTQLTG